MATVHINQIVTYMINHNTGAQDAMNALNYQDIQLTEEQTKEIDRQYKEHQEAERAKAEEAQKDATRIEEEHADQ
jgi:hypothetical protein